MADYAEKVDKYIEENEIKKSNPESGAVAGMYRFTFAAMTLGIWPFIRNRFLRTPYFHQYIHNRKGFYKVEDVQKEVDHVLEQEATQLKEGEEVLFAITCGGSIGLGPYSMIFTQDRLLYALEDPKRTKMGEKSGEIKLTDLGKPTVKRTMADNCIVGFGDENIGALVDFKNDEMLLDFLRQIKLALNN